jgi:hypothetical protein
VHTAQSDGKGGVDDTKSAQKLGQDFDLGDGQGPQRIDAMKTALYNSQGYNKHVGTQQLANIFVGMANTNYGFRVAKQPVMASDGTPMRVVQVWRGKAGTGPGTTILIPDSDFYGIANINQDWRADQDRQAREPKVRFPQSKVPEPYLDTSVGTEIPP